MRYSEKWPQYAKDYDRMAVKKAWAGELDQALDFARANHWTYETVAQATGSHWAFIAAIHKRESDPDKKGNPRFDTYLGNGQVLWKKTTIVPKGRGPWDTYPRGDFRNFVDGAVDAFKVDHLDRVFDWRLEKYFYYAELLNGFGYHVRGLPSPYLWAGTNVQVIGKFDDDGHFNAKMWDRQIGIVPMMAELTLANPIERET